jgi:hypothetical protein
MKPPGLTNLLVPKSPDMNMGPGMAKEDAFGGGSEGERGLGVGDVGRRFATSGVGRRARDGDDWCDCLAELECILLDPLIDGHFLQVVLIDRVLGRLSPGIELKPGCSFMLFIDSQVSL